MTEPKITLYWLSQSRSHRILWLLEELNLPYDLQVFKRNEQFRAPKELFEIHPLGKSPMMRVDDELILETGAITQYLLEKFDKDHKLSGTDEHSKIQENFYIHYCEGSLQPNLVALLVLNMTKSRLPWFIKPVGGKVVDAVLDNFYLPEIYSHLDYLETCLEGKEYFVGDKLTAADILMSFPLISVFESNRLKLTKSYPNLKRWTKMISGNETLIKCNQIAEQHELKP